MVLAGGSSNNPLAQFRALPSLELGAQQTSQPYSSQTWVCRANALTLVTSRPSISVRVGSNLRLIDVPISNCIRSGINKVRNAR